MSYEQADGADGMVPGRKVVEAEIEDRATPRLTLLIRTAKLICGDIEYLCVIRDVSAEGISVRVFHPLPSDAGIILEMQAGDNHRVNLVWQKSGNVGFQFVTPVDVEQIFRRSSRFPKRELRFSAALPVKLVVSGTRHPAVLHNISQQGALIESSERLAIDQLLRIESRNLPEIEAKVRWRNGEQYGLIFETTFRLHDLAGIIHMVQKRPMEPGPAAVQRGTEHA